MPVSEITGLCARCRRAPAAYIDKGSGRACCADCLFRPGSLYGPEYVWQGTENDSYFTGTGHVFCADSYAWLTCSLSGGHSGLHEGWTTGDSNPIAAWDGDGKLWFSGVDGRWFTPDAGTQPPGPGYEWQGSSFYDPDTACAQIDGSGMYTCTLDRAHHGLHEEWRSGGSNPVAAWGDLLWYTARRGWCE